MRQIVSLNRKWAFVMAPEGVPAAMPAPAYFVNVPHSWNAIDGQDGAGDYYRGTCAYVRKFPLRICRRARSSSSRSRARILPPICMSAASMSLITTAAIPLGARM